MSAGERPACRRAGVPDRPRPARRLRPPFGASLEEALAGAEAGLLDEVIPATDGLSAADPLDPSPHFVRGLAEHAAGDAAAAVISLRRAVFLEPGFARASFELARAHESAGDPAAAARFYEQVLAALHKGRPGVDRLLQAREAGDIAAASRGRLRALAARREGPER